MKLLFFSPAVILLFCLFSGCSGSKDDRTYDSIEISLNLNNSTRFEKLSDWVKEVRAIPLETNQKCLLKGIKQVEFYNKKIFVADSAQNTGVYVFNDRGRYQYTIGQFGKGPQEFQFLQCFTIDEKEGLIYLADYYGKKILVFTTDGQFVRSVLTKNSIASLSIYPTGSIFLYSKGENMVEVLDRNQNTTVKLFPQNPLFDFFAGIRVTRNGSSSNFLTVGIDTIFSIEQDSLIPKYRFNLGMSHYSVQELRKSLNQYKHAPRKLSVLGMTVENDKYLHFMLLNDHFYPDYVETHCLYVKDQSRVIYFSDSESDDLFHSAAFHFIAQTEAGEFVAPIHAYQIAENKSIIQSENSPMLNSDIMKVINRISPDENPLLICYKLK